MAQQVVTMADGWRSTLGREAAAAAAAVRRAPRAVVVREVALQGLAATLAVAGTTIGVGALGVALLVPATALVLLARLRWPAVATVAVGGLMTFVAPGAWAGSCSATAAWPCGCWPSATTTSSAHAR